MKEFGASSSEQMRGLSAEILNATNNSSVYAYTFTAGPSFGRITTISTPFIARLGMTYFF